MTTTITNLPLDETRLILEWVNEPKNAGVCKSWKAATEQQIISCGPSKLSDLPVIEEIY